MYSVSMRVNARFVTTLLSVVFLHGSPAAAQSRTWFGADGASWHSAGNWLPANVPDTVAESARFSGGTGGVALNTNVTINTLDHVGGVHTFFTSGPATPVTIFSNDITVTESTSGGILTLAESTGTAVVNLETSGELLVGNEGFLNIFEGAAVTAGELSLGAISTGDGTILVDGTGSLLDITGAIAAEIGEQTSTGTLTVRNNATANFADVLNLANASTTGSSAVMSVLSGGTITVNDDINVGTGTVAGQSATLTVSGSGTMASSLIQSLSGGGSIAIGSSVAGNSALVDVNNGGIVLGGSGTEIIHENGTLDVNNGTFNARDGGITINGTLTTSGGGQVSNFGDAIIALGAGASGDVDIVGSDGAGTGSSWNTATLSVGVNGGDADLEITGGGQVTAGATTVAQAGGVSSVTISGTDGAGLRSKLTTSDVTIGEGGQATLTIEGGAELENIGAVARVGRLGSGAVSVRGTDGAGGPSRWINAGSLTIGGQGSAGMFVGEGGEVHSNSAEIGVGSSISGNVTVSDATWTNTSDMSVGIDGLASLNVLDGGQVSSGSLFVATGTTPISLLQVSGSNGIGESATLTVAQNLVLGGNNFSSAGGDGELKVGIGGVVNIGNRLRIWDTGTVELVGGTINLAQLDSVFVNVFGTFNFSHGTLNFTTDQTIESGRRIEDALGGSLEIHTAQHLGVEGVATLQSLLTIDGGTFSAGMLVNPQLLDLKRGVLNITNQAVSIDAGGPFGATLDVRENTTISVSLGVTNHGVVKGNGVLGGPFTNAAGGELQGLAGNNLTLTGSSANDGQVTLSGGQVHFTQDFTNNSDGLVIGNGTLRADLGINNSGEMAFSATGNVIGDVTNNPTGTIISAGGTTTFFDDVVNNGTIRTNANSFTVYFGSYSGNGDAGTGTVIMEGDLKPGSSPGTMDFAGALTFGPAAGLEIELGGLVAGNEFDNVISADTVSLDGALDVSLVNGFAPSTGDSFEIITATDILGSFDTVSLPALSGNLQWLVNYQPSGVTLIVGQPGDFDFDGDVDGADFLEWQRNDGTPSGLADWQNNYGNTPLSGVGSSVPEPTAILLLVTCVTFVLMRR